MNKRNQTISRRKLLKGMGIGAGALALAACAVPQATQAPAAPASGEPTAAPAPTTAPASSGPVEIIYWGFSGALGKTEEELINMWNEKQSEVKVTPQVQGNYEETAQKLTAALAAQQGPDMVLLSDVWWFKFYRARALMPLNDLSKSSR
jgi:sn-glycerol 3-phosphate transport system substrate-binding protein